MALIVEETGYETPRRSAFEVRMDILRVAAGGASKPTHIMHRSNTSWLVLQKNLEALVGLGFIVQTGQAPRIEYSITERGFSVLRDYARIVEAATSEAGR